MSARELAELRAALLGGGLAVLPTDTVYGLVAALDSPEGVAALYALKGRERDMPCQVLVYSSAAREAMLGPLPSPLAAAARAVLPGPATCIVPDPAGRYAEAAGRERGSVGVRAPLVDGALAELDIPLVATSANEPGEGDPATLADVAPRLADGAAIRWDGGRLPGTPSSVLDLRPLVDGGPVSVLREGHDIESTLRAVRSSGARTV